MKENKDSIVIYRNKDGEIELHADAEHETIWATESEIAELFSTTQQND